MGFGQEEDGCHCADSKRETDKETETGTERERCTLKQRVLLCLVLLHYLVLHTHSYLEFVLLFIAGCDLQ